jgi:hypothetical protein
MQLNGTIPPPLHSRLSMQSKSAAPGDRTIEGVDMIRHHPRVASAVALTLALASAAPASAKLELNPATGAGNQSTRASTSLCSEVCSASGYVSHNSGAALPHDPRPRAVALAGAGYGYGSTPIAAATTGRPAGARHVTTTVVATRGGAIHGAPTTLPTSIRSHHVGSTAPATPSNGFDWGDAGIGAGGTVALMALLVGGAVGVNSARRRATRSTA